MSDPARPDARRGIWGAGVLALVVAAAFLHAQRADRAPAARPAHDALRVPADRAEAAAGRRIREFLSEGPRFDARAWAAAVAADASPDRVAEWMRVATDRSLAPGVRAEAVVALCRPGSDAAFDAMVGIALDTRERPDLRRFVLCRLDRFGHAAPSSLRALLGEPWCGLDELAAVLLAAAGDPEAPSLVLDARRSPDDHAAWWDLGTAWTRRLLPDAAVRVARGDASVTAAAEALRLLGDVSRDEREWLRLGEALGRWIGAHPDALDTEFGRACSAMSAATDDTLDWYVFPPETFDEIADARTDGVMDPSAVVHAVTESLEQESRGGSALDRLAARLRPAVDAAADAESKLRAIEAVLPAPAPPGERWARIGDAITVTGGSVADATLWLGLARRLGLPLRAAYVPRHASLVWDTNEGTIVVDPVRRGRRVRLDALAAAAPSPGLRRLGDRQFAALALWEQAVAGTGGASRLAAEAAYRLDPDGAEAWVQARRCEAPLEEDDAFPRGSRQDTADAARERAAIASATVAIARDSVADVAALRARVAAAPDDHELRMLVALRLFDDGRYGLCSDILERFPAGVDCDPEMYELRDAADEAELDRRPASLGDRSGGISTTSMWLRVRCARRLVTGRSATPAEAEMALELLGPVQFLEDDARRVQLDARRLPGVREGIAWDYEIAKVRALRALGRESEARALLDTMGRGDEREEDVGRPAGR